MPVYQYACTDCHEELEVRQSFADSSLTVCPTCSGRLRKVLSAVGVVFKGSGFYRNDSRSKPNEAAGAPSSTESTKEAASTTTASTTESSSSDSGRNASQPAAGSKTAAAKDSSSSAKTSVAG